MKKNLLLLFLTVLLSVFSVAAQTTYYWVGGTSGDWSVAANWNQTKGGGGTTRTSPATNDILVFDGTNVGSGVLASALTITNVANETIGSLQIVGNNVNVSIATVAGTSGAGTITRGSSSATVAGTGTSFTTFFVVGDFIYTSINSSLSQITAIADNVTLTTGETSSTAISNAAFKKANMLKLTASSNAFSVATGCTLTMAVTTPLVLKLVSGAKGAIDGTIVLNATAQRLVATDSKALTFNAGSTFNAGASFSGNPFSVVANATNDNIYFDAGSSYNYQAGSNPFGANAPASVVQFNDASNFLANSGSAISLSGRAYGNLVFGANQTVSGAPTRLNNLTVNSGFTLTLNTGSAFPISGNILLNGTAAITATSNFPKFIFCGTNINPQTVTAGTGTITSLASIYVASDADVTIGANITLTPSSSQTGSISGKLNIGTNTITGNTNAICKVTSNTVYTSITGDLTIGSQVITNVSNTTNFNIGATVSGTGIPVGAVVLTTTSNTVTISKLPTANSTSVALTTYTSAGTLVTANTSGIAGSFATFSSIDLRAGSNYVFNGATTTPFPSSVSPANLTINANVALNNAVNLTGVLTVASTKTLTTGGNLTLISNATGTASIGNTEGSISGNVTVQRYIPAGNRAFRFLSPAVTTTNFIKANWQEGAISSTDNPVANFGVHITGSTVDQSNGFDGTLTGNASLFQFNNNTQVWNLGIANTNATNLIAGNAYRVFVRGNRSFDLTADPAPITNTATTLRATGTVITGTVTMNATGIGATPDMPLLATAASEFSFVGNPYASSANWASVNTASTDITGYYYIWDPKLGTRGAYVSCYTDGTKSNALSAVTTDVQSGQAIFIQNKSTLTTGPSLVFQESHKTTGTTAVFKNQSVSSKLSIELFLAANSSMSQDAALVSFNSVYSNWVDDDDAKKMTNLDENIAIVRNAKLMSIEQHALPENNDTVQLKMWQFTASAYSLKISADNFANNINAVLQDSYLNTETAINLNASTFVNFSINADAGSYAAERFRIIFKTNNALAATFISIAANKVNEGVSVNWKTANEQDVKEYSIEKSDDGISFETKATIAATGLAQNQYSWLDDKFKANIAYYRIKSIDKSGKVNYSAIVKIKQSDVATDIALYPIPLKGNTINLQMMNIAKGAYSVNMFNYAGQLVFSKTIDISADNTVYNLQLSTKPAAGLYSIKIKSANAEFIKTIIVE